MAATLNGALNRVRVRARRGDLFAPLAGHRYDVIVSNPPYVPAATDRLPVKGPERAWDAGLAGRTLIDRIAADAVRHLRPGGTLLLVQSSLCGVEPTLEQIERTGLEARVEARRRGPLGPLLTARARDLEERGLLRPGEREEELVVVRAQDAAATSRL